MLFQKRDMSLVRIGSTFFPEVSAAKIWLAASLSKTMRSIGESFRPSDEPPPDSFKAHFQIN
jgi:hypothetical protein